MSNHYFKNRVARDTDRGDYVPRLAFAVAPPASVQPVASVSIAREWTEPVAGHGGCRRAGNRGSFREAGLGKAIQHLSVLRRRLYREQGRNRRYLPA